MAKRFGWLVMALLALGVASYAVAVLAMDHVRSHFVVSLFARAPLPVILHLVGGATALVCGALQFNTRLRQRHRKVHRVLGRIYVLAIAASGMAALDLATHSTGGMPTHLGFGGLATLWLGTTLMAFWHIRHRRIAQHQAWMIRSYALTLAAVTLRIYIPLSQIFGLPFGPSYIAISWLCWVPNLLVAEWWIRARNAGDRLLFPVPDAQVP
jgi:uncharacterized membrane protein